MLLYFLLQGPRVFDYHETCQRGANLNSSLKSGRASLHVPMLPNSIFRGTLRTASLPTPAGNCHAQGARLLYYLSEGSSLKKVRGEQVWWAPSFGGGMPFSLVTSVELLNELKVLPRNFAIPSR